MLEDEGQVTGDVRDYYAIQKNNPAKSCCNADAIPKFLRNILKDIHPDVNEGYWGCGLNIPNAINGTRILDLGSGSGRDCYLLSKLVGEDGFVTGVEMTDEQVICATITAQGHTIMQHLLESSYSTKNNLLTHLFGCSTRKYIEYHRDKFGFCKSNTEFKKGYIEKLNEAGINDKDIDLIISNCVICLTPDKEAVLKEAYRVLKNGGEMYFSDMYSEGNLPADLVNNSRLWAKGYGGALYWQDFYEIAHRIGFLQPMIVSVSALSPETDEISKLLGKARFASVTYRLFKISKHHKRLRKTMATYKGTVEGYPDTLFFTYDKTFKKNEPVEVTGDLAKVLWNSRYSKHFDLMAIEDNENLYSVASVNPFDILNN